MDRKHDNLIVGLANIDSSGPLDWNDPVNSPRVYKRPSNIRQIVTLWGRLKAAWLVFSFNAVALKWYDQDNMHTYGDCWYEKFAGPNRGPLRAPLSGKAVEIQAAGVGVAPTYPDEKKIAADLEQLKQINGLIEIPKHWSLHRYLQFLQSRAEGSTARSA